MRLKFLMRLRAPEGGEGGGGTGETPPPPVKPPPAAPPPPAVKTPTSPGETPPAAKVHEMDADGDDDIPDEAERLNMTPKAFRSRLARASKKTLVAAFGTDKVDEIKAKLDKADALEKAEEARRQAALTAEQKAKEEHAKEKARADAAELRAEEAEARRDREVVQAKVENVAQRHVKAKASVMRTAVADLRDHVKGLTDKEAAAFDEKAMDGWFTSWVKENPEFGKTAGVEDPPEVRVNIGAGGGKGPPAGSAGSGSAPKTFKPGLPNSMTDEEARDARKKAYPNSY